MDARLLRVSVLLAATFSLGAGYSSQGSPAAALNGSCQSTHFIVYAPSSEFARQVCTAAEQFRRDLAIEWLGQELPAWRDRCPIRVTVGPHLGAGGATSFAFVQGQPIDWQMTIQGSRQRVLDSVLPHEITHTILATHFGRPLPRWADEGAATSVEHISERSKQQKLLIEFLTSDRGIAFNHMFAMKEYPQDILPLYSQGYSLARFLIAQRGKHAFIRYVGDGMRTNNWTAATQEHYGLKSLSVLQLSWLDWVRQGSPHDISPVQLASHTQPTTSTANAAGSQPIPTAADRGGAASRPGQSGAAPAGQPPREAIADRSAGPQTATSQGWYRRQRDQAARQTAPQSSATSTTASGSQSLPSHAQQLAHPQSPQRPRQIALPADPCPGGSCPASGTVWR